MKQLILVTILLLVNASALFGEPMQESDIPFRITSWHVAYDVNADGSFTETQKWSATVLKENALEGSKTASMSFSTSVAKGEILEAYTIKKSGQRIDVPKESYQVTIDDGYKKESPLYSDETTISVVFPDLAVGDSVAFSYRVVNSEGIFPNHFSVLQYISRYTACDDVSIYITAPSSMELRYKSYFLAEQKPLIKNGRRTLRWRYSNRIPEKWTPADRGITSVGDDPSLYLSTFGSYKEITDAYGVRAVPKAAVTDRVKRLAAEIAADRKTPESQARAIYDWVTKNISFGGNCIGIGTVVPRDMNVVLDNKMGDCKDHATLLQALLAAKNIESEQALINAGGLYQLPEVPVVSAVNHVINYIPGLDLFLDSTSSIIPFGMLPLNLGEKPVLLVTHYRDGVKTPSNAQYGHEQVMRTKIKVNQDGSADGNLELTMKGIPAVAARAVMRLIPGGQENLVAKSLLESQGAHGSATLIKDDPSELLDSYRFSLSFKLDDFVTVGSATGIPIRPVAGTFFPIESFLNGAYEPDPKKPQSCSGGSSIEEYELEFPKAMNILSVPKDFELSTPGIYYRATYSKNANKLNVRRELKDNTPTNICSPQYVADYNKLMLSIAKDLKSQIILGE